MYFSTVPQVIFVLYLRPFSHFVTISSASPAPCCVSRFHFTRAVCKAVPMACSSHLHGPLRRHLRLFGLSHFLLQDCRYQTGSPMPGSRLA
ncbi:hypothetical protein IWX49DRAFT_53346 [Phyllosticta citricarpa]|uniref:Secreted protein n=1 Tax=Phyllosticta citricarpa TaxID=55181 RepID=A0ABR1MPL9_9PEZI